MKACEWLAMATAPWPDDQGLLLVASTGEMGGDVGSDLDRVEQAPHDPPPRRCA